LSGKETNFNLEKKTVAKEQKDAGKNSKPCCCYNGKRLLRGWGSLLQNGVLG